MKLSHAFVSRAVFFALASSALPALAANCSPLAGEHYGTFTAKKTRGEKDHPQTIEGNWKVKLDGKTCEVTGTVTSAFTGTVNVSGNYGPYRNGAKGAAFDPSDIFFQEEQKQPKYMTFAFGSDKPDTNYVNINTNNFAYWGSFKADK